MSQSSNETKEPQVTVLDTRLGSVTAGAHFSFGPVAAMMPLRDLKPSGSPSDAR